MTLGKNIYVSLHFLICKMALKVVVVTEGCREDLLDCSAINTLWIRSR